MSENRDNLEQETIQDEEIDRGMPSINGRNRPRGGIMQKIAAGIGAIILVLALIAVNGGFSSDDDDFQEEETVSRSSINNRLGPAPEMPAPPPPAPPEEEEDEGPVQPEIIRTGQVAPPAPNYPTGPTNSQNGGEDQPPTPQERKTTTSLLAFGSVSGSGQSGQAPMSAEAQAQQMAANQGGGMGGMLDAGLPMGGEDGPDRADGLGAALRPTQLEGTRAGLISDRNMFVTQGTFLDCALETAISSDVPGMTSCRLTRDVYSTSGKVLLLERGSRIIGQYQGGLERGQARVFVLWNRVETPTGVIINLDSPGTDALGRSGHDGYLDTHFWERFGGAIMLSLIDDVGTYVANQAGSSNGNNQIQFGGTSQAATNAANTALENSIAIRPTLVKHQGDHISVFVARDLDFRGVYDLRTD